MKASDADAAVAALSSAMTVEDALVLREQFLAAGDLVTPNGVAQTAAPSLRPMDSLGACIVAMDQARSHRALIVDGMPLPPLQQPGQQQAAAQPPQPPLATTATGAAPGRLLGVVTLRDLLRFFLELPSAQAPQR